MRLRTASQRIAATTLGLALSAYSLTGYSNEVPPPLAIEKTGNVESLPASYPESWVMIDEVSFFSMYGGKIIIMDVMETNPAKRIKGMVHKNLLGNFTQHENRSEFYILESFHERGWRGKKTDVFVVYDRSSLKIKKEIVWPTDRLQALPERFAMTVSGDGKHVYAANFTPAGSFSVVRVSDHKLLGPTIGTPGCVMTFPAGKRSVASLCNNGGMLTTVVNEDGSMKSQERMAAFFDTMDTPIFERPAIVKGQAYFPSFKGLMHHIDLSGELAKYKGSWSLISDEERKKNWRPSGLGLIDKDDAGLIYLIMQPDGAEGTQSHGGPQVWVFDPKHKKRVRVIEAPNHAISLAVTRGKEPKLVVTNGTLGLDVIDAKSGELIQTIADFGSTTPLLVHKSF